MRLDAVVAGCWLLGSTAALGYAAHHWTKPAERPTGAATVTPMDPVPQERVQLLDGQSLRLTEAPVTVLNFWNATCPCSADAVPMVRELVDQWGKKDVRFVTIADAPKKWSDEELLKAWNKAETPTPFVRDDGTLAKRFGVWAAPAAVIVDSTGKVRYIGAYNIRKSCNDPRTAFAAKAIEALIQGKEPEVTRLPFYGCQPQEEDRF